MIQCINRRVFPTKLKECDVIQGVSEVFVYKDLGNPDLSPDKQWLDENLNLVVSKPPVRLLGLPPVMKAEHDGEGAGG